MSERIPDYAQGFKDGFAAGLEEGKKIKEKSYMDGLIEGMKKTLPPPYVPPGTVWGQRDTCPKCGIKISGVMGYVCSSPNCPTFPQVTCGVVTGSDLPSYTTGTSVNGPAGGLHDGLGKSFW